MTNRKSEPSSLLTTISIKLNQNENANKDEFSSLAVRARTFTKRVLSRKRLERKLLVIFFVFLFAINIHFLLFLKINPYRLRINERQNIKNLSVIIEYTQNMTRHFLVHFECAARLGSWYSYFMDKIWFWVDVFVYFVIPFLTMCITFSIIKFKLKSINRNYATILLDRTYNNYNKRIYLRKIRRNKKIIYIIFATNVYFCLSILPFLIFSIMKNLNCYLSSKEFFYVKFLVEILFYSNNAFNFVFYGLTSKEYRKALKRMFSFDKKTQTKTKSSKKPIQVKRNLFCKKTN